MDVVERSGWATVRLEDPVKAGSGQQEFAAKRQPGKSLAMPE